MNTGDPFRDFDVYEHELVLESRRAAEREESRQSAVRTVFDAMALDRMEDHYASTPRNSSIAPPISHV